MRASYIKKHIFAGLLASLSILPLTAWAGFEWTPVESAPPSDAMMQAPSISPMMPSPLVPSVDSEALTPVPGAGPSASMNAVPTPRAPQMAPAPADRWPSDGMADTPMPIIPPDNAVSPDALNASPVVGDRQTYVPRYIRRTRPNLPPAEAFVMENPPADAAPGEPVAMAAADTGAGVINPFPLQSEAKGRGMPVLGVTPLEEAILQYGGEPASLDGGPAPVTVRPHAVGFGRDLPLSLVAAQIVPEGYTVSFGAGVNTEEVLSWQGGAPWDDVLTSTLEPLGLRAVIGNESRKVLIERGSSGNFMSMPAVMSTASDVAPRLLQAAATRPSSNPAKVQALWEAPKGASLRQTLTQWSDQAGVELYWSSEFDFPLQSTVRLSGTFEDAVQNILTGLKDAQPRPIGRLHPNLPDGPAVLVIETRHIIE